MPRIPETTNRQSSFLRTFRTTPSGPPPADWPSPAILRRWLRRPSFRRAADSLLASLRFQADFQLSAAATSAIQSLSAPGASASDNDAAASHAQGTFYRLLRLAHLRQRFSPALPTDPPPDPADPQHSAPSTQHSAPPLRRIGEPLRNTDPNYVPKLTPRQVQIIAQQHNLHDINHIPDEVLFKIAWKRGCSTPLRKVPFFPDPSVVPPTPQERFYRDLIMAPDALIWYLRLYGQHTGDHRHSHILAACKHFIPQEHPTDKPFPRFTPAVVVDKPSPPP